MSFYMPIVLTIFAAVALPAYIVHNDASKMFAERLSKRQHQLVRSLSYGLITRFDDALLLTEVISAVEEVRNFVGQPAEREDHLPGLMRLLRRASERHAEDSILYVLDCQGAVLAAERPLAQDEIPLPAPELMDRAMRGHPQVGTVRLKGELTPIFVAPVMEHGRCQGAVALTWPFDDMGKEWRELAESGRDGMRILLVDREGQVVFVASGDEHSTLKVGSQMSDTSVGRVFLSGQDGTHAFVDRYGQERVGVYFRLPEVGWTAVISSPHALVTGAAQTLTRHSLNIALIFGALAGLLVSGLAWRMLYGQRQGARHLSMLMQGAGMGVWECRMPGTFSYSSRWARVVGLREMPGALQELGDMGDSGDGGERGTVYSTSVHHMLEYVHPDDRESLLRLGRGEEGAANFSVEFRFRQADGGWRWVQSWGRVLQYDSDGTPLHISGVSMDIDLRKQAEQSEAAQRSHLEALVVERTKDLRRARDQALAATEAKSYFLSTMSHEIRTPMNAIMGFLQLFDRENLSARQTDYLQKIRTAAAGLLGVINDILDISKIEAGKLEVEKVPFSLRTVMDAVYSIMSFAAREKGLVLQKRVADDVPDRIMGDPTRLHQILLNLLSNAVKFTRQGGIRVEVARREGAAGAWLDFAVVDSGVGISPEQQQRLFQPYSQADASVTRRFGGTGLGLAICKQLVELMGGSIALHSELGQGTTFTFHLRLQEAPLPEQDILPVDTSAQSLHGVRVLLVEDNIINQEVARTQLEHMGMTVEVAENGEEGVRMVEQEAYDVVLMDMQMPVLDGLEATQRIRALGGQQGLERLADLPIIAMTANAMSEDRRRCLEAGMNGHIAKPFDVEELRALLLRFAGKRQAELSASP